MPKLAKSILWIAPLAAVAFIGIYFASRESPTPVSYATTPVQRGEVVETVSATGSLNPLITVQVGSQVSGTIQHLYADFNDRVKKDQVIAQIEPSLFKAQVAQAEANMKSAEAARGKAWVGVLDARRSLQRTQTLVRQKMVPESELDTARFAYESALAEHKVREAAVAQARAALEQTKVNLAHTTIYAPIDGVVISRDVDVGQTVAASFQAPTIYTIARDLTRMQIEAEVDEAFIGRIRVGEPVTFTVFAYPDRVFHGRMAQVRLNPQVEAGVVKYNCIIHVDNADLALKPGMTATVAIEVARHENVLKVTNRALRFIPDLAPERLAAVRKRLKRGEAVLWRPSPAGLEPLVVKTGLVGERETEVSGSGLKEGMRIAIPSPRGTAAKRRRHGFRLF